MFICFENALFFYHSKKKEKKALFVLTFYHLLARFWLLSQLYLTDLSTRESLLLCTKEHPILQLALQDDSIWAATTDSSLHRWPAEGRNPQRVFQKGGSFVAGNFSFMRARACLEGSTPVSHTCLVALSCDINQYLAFTYMGSLYCDALDGSAQEDIIFEF